MAVLASVTASWPICLLGPVDGFAGRRVLLLCDIDRAEETPLDPDRAPALRAFDLLVELHGSAESSRLRDLMRALRLQSCSGVCALHGPYLAGRSVGWVSEAPGYG